MTSNHNTACFDVFIAGSGSAGLCAALWLSISNSNCPSHPLKIKIVDSRPGPLEIGQADGVQCRTVEIFDSFGIAEGLLRESYWVCEDVFWGVGEGEEGKGIKRLRREMDTKKGLSYMPHVILNQARVNGLMIEKMKEMGGTEVDYGVEVRDVKVGGNEEGEYPVTVVTARNGKEEVFKAKYVLGCDGAHSAVRKALGFKMIGDSSNAVWGVMDIYPLTNFPDIRLKSIIRSSSGSLMIIPREGGSLVRFYIELPPGTAPKSVTLLELQTAAKKIFHPYEMDFAGTFWWSAYSIGQRLADHFSKDNRVFLTGDACHTHSPKAGQGMNVSLQDGYNIGWKLAQVLQGQAPTELLKTYNLEREKVAADLIAFDRQWSKAISSSPEDKNLDFSEVFVQAGEYTAGLGTVYGDSVITKMDWSGHNLAGKLEVGMRFPSAPVVRVCDAKPMQLVKALPADGRWRVVVFAGDLKEETGAKKLKELADYLSSGNGQIGRFTQREKAIDSYIEPILVLSGERICIEQEQIPEYFWPATGKWKMRDLHKTFVDDESYNNGHGHAYDFYGLDPAKKGVVVIVRPDQYISMVVGIDEHEKIGNFFEGFAIPQQ